MSEIKIHIFHIGKVCVAPELPFGGEHYSALKASGVLDRQIRSLGSLPLYFTNQVVVESGAAIDEQLAARGVAPVDWDAVLLSHLDCDHANGLKPVADAKKILVLKDELRFAENGSPVNRIRYNADWWRGTKMQTFDWNGLMGSAGRSYDVFGDGMLVMVNIPGHSKGLCALRITGEDGRLRRWRPREKIVGADAALRHRRRPRGAEKVARVDQDTESGAELRCVHRQPRFRCQTGRDYIIKE